MKGIDRRQFISRTAGSVAAATATGSGTAAFAASSEDMAPAYDTLSQGQAETLASWCDVLVEGAANAHVAQFVDAAISAPYAESLTMSRFFVSPPLSRFYLSAIAGIDQESKARFGKAFAALDIAQRLIVVDAAANRSTLAWREPDPGLFFLLSRSDAVDVVYGTPEGFIDLDIPYLAHVAPTRLW